MYIPILRFYVRLKYFAILAKQYASLIVFEGINLNIELGNINYESAIYERKYCINEVSFIDIIFKD